MARYKAPRIASTLLRFACTLLIFSICGILIWRVFLSTRIPNEVDSLLPNEQLSAAYAAHGESITLRYQDLASITRAEKNSGYFSIEECVFIPEAQQVQILFRYNNSTIRNLSYDYGMAEIPDKAAHLFDVSLVRTTDLTPADKSDNLDPATLAHERILPAEQHTRAETLLYTYYRYVFNGVTIEDITDAVYIDVYYVGDCSYEAPAYGTLCIYAYDEVWYSHRPSKADRRALAGA